MMKKLSIITMIVTAFLLLTILSGCSSKNPEDFAEKAAGVWQRNGNLQDERLEVLDDCTWSNQTLQDGVWTTIAQGTIAYNKEYKTFEFSDDMSNKIYPVEFFDSDIEILYFHDNYFRAENSIDGFATFNGKWCNNADAESDYYILENGEWKWFEPQSMAHVSVNDGNLAWNGAEGKLLAYSYSDGEIFAEFVPSDTGDLLVDDVPYVFEFVDFLSSDEVYDDYDDYTVENDLDDVWETTVESFPIITHEYYYLNGDIEQEAFCFYNDGLAYYSESSESESVQINYIIDNEEIVINTPDGETIDTLIIINDQTLYDSYGNAYMIIAD